MTAEQKTAAAEFLGLASGYLGSGYKKPSVEYSFADDAPTSTLSSSTSASDASPLLPGEPLFNDSLEQTAADIKKCDRCPLCKTRKNTVPGEGVGHPLVMVIGEGPGADEDASGRPFVGRAGHLLDLMLYSKGQINLSREKNCYIANMVKCRASYSDADRQRDRPPVEDEIAACIPFLRRQIAVLKPLLILSAGAVPTRALLDTVEGITRLRGQWKQFEGIPLLPTFHPSALLRDEALKSFAWEDMKTLRKKLCALDADYAKQFKEIF
jgi:DNA polymerase